MKIFENLSGLRIHMVGIKGTGMAALAEMLAHRDTRLSGSDGKEHFYTDDVLAKLGIPVFEEFSATHISEQLDLVIHSTAYSRQSHPEIIEAIRLGVPVLTYPEALGQFSRLHEFCAVSGMHGKTTTTALAGILARKSGLPATVLVGSQVPGFGDSCTLSLGRKYFIAEACEYRGSFLNFDASHILLTPIEHDHPDYFPTLEDVYKLFVVYLDKLPAGGTVIYNADDPGSLEVIRRINNIRQDLTMVSYGRNAEGAYRIDSLEAGDGQINFSLNGFTQPFHLRVPGTHNVWNAAGAIALVETIWNRENGKNKHIPEEILCQALQEFSGTRRRSELIGEKGGVVFLDDYGHHPTAVKLTLEGYRAFYPGRRLIVDFMPHTYSRSAVLLNEFAGCFNAADILLLNGIYASAREQNESGIDGADFFAAVKAEHPDVGYYPDFYQAVSHLLNLLRPGDLLVTMGAGDNWKIGREVFRRFQSRGKGIPG